MVTSGEGTTRNGSPFGTGVNVRFHLLKLANVRKNCSFAGAIFEPKVTNRRISRMMTE